MINDITRKEKRVNINEMKEKVYVNQKVYRWGEYCTYTDHWHFFDIHEKAHC